MLPMVAEAVQHLFHEPKDIFYKGKVMDLLFKGIPVDCTSSDFNAKAICAVFEAGEVKAVQKHEVEEEMYTFSLFGAVSTF